ncbi:GILT-like protein 3 [Anopheles ziemanni]|uniref:GILT-like protein 3 n=1 Tax=Anopheles coustani TaxID=139045 RepID=UPI002658FC09|nr:GILT-like protein 3 [Anopheles coustani]XP_058169213.1 GILT-like protein 3 [Anopheles ziemanni]
MISSSLAFPAGEETNTTTNQTVKKLPVTVYYETLCGDSMVFITYHLYPTWLRRSTEMNLRLVPFGKASIDEEPDTPPKYYCQHGPRECKLNILHGCILDKLPFEKAFPVVACLMKNFRTDFETCIKGHEASKQTILDCSEGQQGATLFKQFANETDNVHRPLPFVPSIVGDQPYDYYEQDDWLYRFDKTFAKRYEAKFGVKL